MKKIKRRQKPAFLLKQLWFLLEIEVQEDLADLLGCTQSTISYMYSRNKVSRKMKVKIEVLTKGRIKKKDWLK